MGKIHRIYLDEIPESLALHSTLGESSLKPTPVPPFSSTSIRSRPQSPVPRPKGKIYACKTCGTHLTHSLSTNLVSTSFTGNCGKAFLFRSMYNTIMTEPVKRSMTTGEHVVSDLKCSGCEETIGWKYLKAYNQSQKYKEGCFILEITNAKALPFPS